MLAGEHAVNAAEAGMRTRFRPVTMTAVAFIIGVLPLAFATGAGAAARRSIGTTVFGGVLLAKRFCQFSRQRDGSDDVEGS